MPRLTCGFARSCFSTRLGSDVFELSWCSGRILASRFVVHGSFFVWDRHCFWILPFPFVSLLLPDDRYWWQVLGCLLLYEYLVWTSLTSYSLGIRVGVSDLDLRLAWVPISFVF